MITTLKKNEILIENNYINIPVGSSSPKKFDLKNQKLVQSIGTILNNMSYYGYMPSAATYEAMLNLDINQLEKFWNEVQPAFAQVTGENRNMDRFVVYKNFPKEVLEMSEATYWINQILMYWGIPNELFSQTENKRDVMTEQKHLKVLGLADENTLVTIFNNLVKSNNRWSDKQSEAAMNLAKEYIIDLDMDLFSFKENGINIVAEALKDKNNLAKMNINISNATDVLRLAAAMSDGDVSLRENVKFRKFSRPERKFLLKKLEYSNNLSDDFGLRKEEFKRLLKQLHPGDYNFKKVKAAYNSLYVDNISTYNSKVETKLENNDISVLNELQSRPGDFFRRLHHVHTKFGKHTVDAFSNVLPELDTLQLVKINKYINTINDRKNLMYPPKGNWTKAQIAENKKQKFNEFDLEKLNQIITDELSKRLEKQFPEGVALDPKVEQVKLQTNDQKLANYGRGTSFDIPPEMKFIRSASYWKQKSGYSTWFDNGWNFFDSNWSPVGTCCWDHTHELGDAAVFSGDPTNSKDMEGRACQMIDLYLDKLEEKGIRYAVWNILGYSGIKFSDADEVLATLQWGENPQEGKLYEPSRAQMVFPLTSEALSSYIAYIDVVERKLVYMDANLYGHKSSAGLNTTILKEKMPAYLEYLDSLPSVADLFIYAKEGITPILYSDKDTKLEENQAAYVFKLENADNDIKRIDLACVLEGEKIEVNSRSKIKSKL